MKLRFLYAAGPVDNVESLKETAQLADEYDVPLVVNGLYTPDEKILDKLRRIRDNLRETYDPQKNASLDSFILQDEMRQSKDYRTAIEAHFHALLETYSSLPDSILLVPGTFDVSPDRIDSFRQKYDFSISDDLFEEAGFAFSFCDVEEMELNGSDRSLLGIGGTPSFDPELPDLIQHGEFRILEQTNRNAAVDLLSGAHDFIVTGAGLPGTYEHLEESETHDVYSSQPQEGELILDRFEAEPTVDQLVTRTEQIPLIHGRVREMSGGYYIVRSNDTGEHLAIDVCRGRQKHFSCVFDDRGWTISEADEEEELFPVDEESPDLQENQAAETVPVEDSSSDVSEPSEKEMVESAEAELELIDFEAEEKERVSESISDSSSVDSSVTPDKRDESEMEQEEEREKRETAVEDQETEERSDEQKEEETERVRSEELLERAQGGSGDRARSESGSVWKVVNRAAAVLLLLALGAVAALMGAEYWYGEQPGSVANRETDVSGDVKAELKSMNERINTLSSNMAKITKRTQTSREQLQSLRNAVNNQDQTVKQTREKLDVLQEKLAAVSKKMEGMTDEGSEEAPVVSKKQFASLQKKVEELESKIKAASTGAGSGTKTEAVASEIGKLRGQVYGRRIVFEDDYLKQAVLDAIEKEGGDVHVGDVQKLQKLDASGKSIKSLEGLQHIPFLEELDLSDNQISDLGPIANHEHLRVVNLNGNQIQELKPLTSLSSLTKLKVSFNEINDLEPLSELTGLKHLELEYNQITTLAPISGLTNLKKLYLGANQISSLSVLTDLNKLTVLSLWGNKIDEVTALSKLKNLERLNLNYNMIHNLAPLSLLNNLEYLYVKNNWVRDVDALKGQHQLKELNLSKNPVSDLKKKKNQKIVRGLQKNGCRVTY